MLLHLLLLLQVDNSIVRDGNQASTSAVLEQKSNTPAALIDDLAGVDLGYSAHIRSFYMHPIIYPFR